MKKIIHFFLVFLFLFLSCPIAYGNEVADISREGSIQISLKNEQGKNISDIELSLYKVADVRVDNGYIFEYAQEFASLQADIDTNLAKVEYINQLSDYVKKNQVPALAKINTSSSTVAFEHLPMGLYLVAQTNQVPGYASTNPFLITIPFRHEDGSLSYDVDATPKTSILQKVEEAKVIRDKRLPQTGQLWWPVWVLLGVGIILCTLGVLGKRHEKIHI